VKKTFRQGQILNLIRTHPVHTQEELAHALQKLGIDVAQVTLSRDIRELGLLKTADGYREASGLAAAPGGPSDQSALQRAVEEFVLDIKVAGNLLIIKTHVGGAQPVGLALDQEGWPEIAGTLAGDDTVFAAAPDARRAARAREKLLALLR